MIFSKKNSEEFKNKPIFINIIVVCIQLKCSKNIIKRSRRSIIELIVKYFEKLYKC